MHVNARQAFTAQGQRIILLAPVFTLCRHRRRALDLQQGLVGAFCVFAKNDLAFELQQDRLKRHGRSLAFLGKVGHFRALIGHGLSRLSKEQKRTGTYNKLFDETVHDQAFPGRCE